MNGVHDLGGMDGFGAVIPEADEPVFHEPWEGRVFALNILGVGRVAIPVDALRHRIELLDPLRYLTSTYFERWLAAMAQAILDAGTLTSEEIEARMQQFAASPDHAMPRRENPAHAEAVAAALRAGSPVTRKIRKPARFAIGEHVVTRNLNPMGHTRLPRYARGKRGVIALHHGAHVFPDTNAHGLGEHPQHLYTVRFAARELWGKAAEAKASVLIDLWESYLDSDSSGKPTSGAHRETKTTAKIVKTMKSTPRSAKTSSAATRAKKNP